jgi:hypothetical protein
MNFFMSDPPLEAQRPNIGDNSGSPAHNRLMPDLVSHPKPAQRPVNSMDRNRDAPASPHYDRKIN